MLKCDNHPEREAINCSGWAVRRYLCEECRSIVSSSPRQAARRGSMDFWSGHDDRSTDGRLLRNEYDGTYDTHYIDRSKE